MAHASDLLSQPGSYGSVVFRYTSPSAGNLYANVVLSIHGAPISFPIVARPSWSIPGRMPSSLEGIWWQPRVNLNDVLVISNNSEAKIVGTLILSDASGKQWTQNTALSPRQTLRFSTSELISKAGLSGSYGGISFVSQSPSDGIEAVHFLYDEVSKFSAALDLSSRYPQMSLQERAGPEAKHWTMYAPMLALQNPDPSLGLPRGIALQPTLFIRNTTAKNITADLSLTWRGDSGKGQAKLPQLRLGPFATQQIQIAAMQPLLRIPDNAHWGMVTLTTDSLPDDLVAFATSIDSSGRYNLATRFTGGTGGHFTGGEWDLDANHNEIAAITNIGSKPTNALLTLHYDNGRKSYELQQTIAPGDQMWVNLAQLVRDRVSDRNGNALPTDVGSVTFEVRELTPNSNSIMVSALGTDASYGFSLRTPNLICCGTLNGSVEFGQGLLNLFVGIDDSIWVDGTDACNSQVDDISSDFPSWNSDNQSIAKLTYKNAEGVAAGSTTGFANGNVFMSEGSYCAYNPQQPTLPITVQVPDHLSVVDDNEGYPQCAQNQEPIYLRQMQMQVVDPSNKALGFDVDIVETQQPAQPTNTCPGGGSPVPSSCASTGGASPTGQFIDSMTVNKNLCVAKGSVPAGCGFSVTSTWAVCGIWGNNTLWLSPRVTHSDSVKVDGSSSAWPKGTQCTGSGC